MDPDDVGEDPGDRQPAGATRATVPGPDGEAIVLTHELVPDRALVRRLSFALLLQMLRGGAAGSQDQGGLAGLGVGSSALRPYVLPGLLVVVGAVTGQLVPFLLVAVAVAALLQWSTYRGIRKGAEAFFPPGVPVASGFSATAMAFRHPGHTTVLPYAEMRDLAVGRGPDGLVTLRRVDERPLYAFPRVLFPDEALALAQAGGAA